MEIVIDLENPEPLFAQLIAQIKEGVAGGELQPGQALPSIRQLANDLELNNKTVAKAYRLLERDEVIQARGYRGTFVHPRAKANCALDINDWVRETLTRTVLKFRESGVTDSEMRIAFSNALNHRHAPGDD